LLPRVRARFSRDVLVAGASALYAVAALALAYVQNIGLLAVAMLATGVAWITILSALQVAAQMTLPAWVRARGLAAFVVVFMSGMALGAILWGQVATRIGIPAALTAAAVGMVLATALTFGLPVTTVCQLHAVDGLAGAGTRRNAGTRQRPCTRQSPIEFVGTSTTNS
jgi:predicted MFS family arabinose efflux permease